MSEQLKQSVTMASQAHALLSVLESLVRTQSSIVNIEQRAVLLEVAFDLLEAASLEVLSVGASPHVQPV